MTRAALWLSSLGVHVVVGVLLLSHQAFRRFPIAGRTVLAGAVGIVLTTWVMTVFALVSLPWNPIGVLTATAALSFSLRLFLRRSDRDVRAYAVRRVSAMSLIAVALGSAAVLLAVIAVRSGMASSPDLLLFWGPKAVRFAAARTIDTEVLADPLMDHLHPDYPPLLTNLYAFTSLLAGGFSWWGAVGIFPLALAATGLGAGSLLGSAWTRERAWTRVAVATCSLGLIGVHAMIGGVGEMPLLFFEALAVSLLLARPNDSSLLLAGLCVAGAAFTKVEGLPLGLATAAIFTAMTPAGRRRKTCLLLVAPTFLILGSWFLFGATRGLFWFYRPYGPPLAIQWERLPVVLQEVGRGILSIDYGLPFLLPILVFLFSTGKSRITAVPIAAAAIFIVFLLTTYLSGEAEVRQWISWSAARVLMPLPMLFALGSGGSHRPGEA